MSQMDLQVAQAVVAKEGRVPIEVVWELVPDEYWDAMSAMAWLRAANDVLRRRAGHHATSGLRHTHSPLLKATVLYREVLS